jgi:osmoprotectant transport system permease protein
MRWDWIGDHTDLLGTLLSQHIFLSVVPIFWGVVIAIPLGVVCVRWPALYPTVLAMTSVLYALPSIALFVVLLDFTGLEPATAIIPLTIYTLSILVRNVVDGLRAVPAHVRDAATAMGFRGLRRLLQVELPIAVPAIMAGVRVATVSNISLVSIASLIGLGGLGQLLVDGFQRDFATPIVVGIVLTIMLAVAADGILVGAQRVLTPWAPRRRAAA